MSLPWVWTEAPVLPVAFTRDRMIVSASFMSALVGVLPFRVVAFMLSWVPLDRSSPRPILKSLCHWDGLNRLPPRMARSMITMSAASAASARPGCGTVFVGAATSPPVLLSYIARAGTAAQKTLSLSDLARLSSCESVRPSSADVASSWTSEASASSGSS